MWIVADHALGAVTANIVVEWLLFQCRLSVSLPHSLSLSHLELWSVVIIDSNGKPYDLWLF